MKVLTLTPPGALFTSVNPGMVVETLETSPGALYELAGSNSRVTGVDPLPVTESWYAKVCRDTWAPNDGNP